MNVITKKKIKPPVRPVLKAMQKFDKVVFGLDRITVVRSTIQLLQSELGYSFRSRKDKETNTLEVIRIK